MLLIGTAEILTNLLQDPCLVRAHFPSRIFKSITCIFLNNMLKIITVLVPSVTISRSTLNPNLWLFFEKGKMLLKHGQCGSNRFLKYKEQQGVC